MKSLHTLSYDTDIMMETIFDIAHHLLYWGLATVIYPLCETNVYVTSSGARLNPSWAEEFATKFNGEQLWQMLSRFKHPITLGELTDPRVTLDAAEQASFTFFNDVSICIMLCVDAIIILYVWMNKKYSVDGQYKKFKRFRSKRLA